MFTTTLLRMIDKINRAWGVRMGVQPEITLYPPIMYSHVNYRQGSQIRRPFGSRSLTAIVRENKCHATARLCHTLTVVLTTSYQLLQDRREAAIHNIHIHTHTYLHTYIPPYLHTYTYPHTHIRTYVHTYIHTCIHTHTHTYTYIHIHTHTYTYIHIHTHTYTDIHRHTQTDRDRQTYIHTYIHIMYNRMFIADKFQTI